MNQLNIDVARFSEIFSKYTGIDKTRIDEYLKTNPINNIFEHPGSICNTIAEVNKIEELRELRNLYDTIKIADSDRYVINSTTKAGEYFKAYMKDMRDKERFVCSFLDSHCKIISTKVMHVGTVAESPVYPREIVKEALLNDAKSVILCHNHPAGSVLPSQADINVTAAISEALKSVDIAIMDHVIVGGDKFLSFADRHMLSSRESQSSFAIKEQYKEDYSAIKFISDKTAKVIGELNNQAGSKLSIEEIKEKYIVAGKKIESGNYSKADIEEFKYLKDIVDDIKQAQLTEKRELAEQKTQERGIKMELDRD